MRTFPAVALALALLGSLSVAAPASAAGDDRRPQGTQSALSGDFGSGLLFSPNVTHLAANPSQVGISGCFLETAPVLVTSGLDSVRTWDVRDAAHPKLLGVLPSLQFENEAMNCGERRTADGIKRFALIGVDLYQSSPGDIDHTNVGGRELVIVDVTDPAAPAILSRADATTSTHTVSCVDGTDCNYVYTAGSRTQFSILDLRDLANPVEVDSDPAKDGVQPFATPTGGHEWNFDDAGIGTHTGWNGASMWSVEDPTAPRVLATTGVAGTGADPEHEGYNDFILHNSFRPNADRFKANRKPSLKRGNILLVTEEDYEQTDCAKAGSFQTWWVKALKGKKAEIVPLDKVELADLGNFPLPQGAFCSSHWFDFHPSGVVAVGFYGGGTQLLDVRKPKQIKPFGHAVWGGSEVWDNKWVPIYNAGGRRTDKVSNVVYAIDLVRGLDVYAVDVPGDGVGSTPTDGVIPNPTTANRVSDGAVSMGLVGGAMALAIAVRRKGRRRTA